MMSGSPSQSVSPASTMGTAGMRRSCRSRMALRRSADSARSVAEAGAKLRRVGVAEDAVRLSQLQNAAPVHEGGALRDVACVVGVVAHDQYRETAGNIKKSPRGSGIESKSLNSRSPKRFGQSLSEIVRGALKTSPAIPGSALGAAAAIRRGTRASRIACVAARRGAKSLPAHPTTTGAGGAPRNAGSSSHPSAGMTRSRFSGLGLYSPSRPVYRYPVE